MPVTRSPQYQNFVGPSQDTKYLSKFVRSQVAARLSPDKIRDGIVQVFIVPRSSPTRVPAGLQQQPAGAVQAATAGRVPTLLLRARVHFIVAVSPEGGGWVLVTKPYTKLQTFQIFCSFCDLSAFYFHWALHQNVLELNHQFLI